MKFILYKKALRLKSKGLGNVSGWQDSNLRPPGPKPGAITGLRYIPNYGYRSLRTFFTGGWDSIRQPAEQFNPRSPFIKNLAERVGFEPTVQFNPYDDLANRSFRPLRHLSEIPKIIIPSFLSSASWRNLPVVTCPYLLRGGKNTIQ